LDATRTLDSPYSQRFVGGTDNRQLVVHFRCNAEIKPTSPRAAAAGTAIGVATEQVAKDVPQHLLTLIEEPTPFHYVAEIKTSLVCQSSTESGGGGILGLLNALSRNCIYLNTGWWLYKFCYLKSIQQLHREHRPIAPTGSTGGATTGAPGQAPSAPAVELVTVAEFDLGHMPKDLSLGGVEKMTKVVEGETMEETYVSQMYENGSRCDVGDRQDRKTEVRFYCDPNEPHALESIVETSSCVYLLKVRTSLLCSDALFAVAEPDIVQITCQPVPKPNSLKR